MIAFLLSGLLLIASPIGVAADSFFATTLTGMPAPTPTLTKSRGQYSMEFCPDETCDLLVAATGDRERFEIFATVYMVYFVRYSDIASWQANSELRERLSRAAEKVAPRMCQRRPGAVDITCYFRGEFVALHVQAFIVRSDEGMTIKSRMPLSQILNAR
jgi:hypothetical protein